jgi:3-deoxy-D-manno-octulosonate 8-phosphate phosphatase (KDO 8-P phosphatase)
MSTPPVTQAMAPDTPPSDLTVLQKDSLTRSRAAGLKAMFFDVDGVMTDGGLFYDGNGEALKRFHVLDGHGLKMLQEAGVLVGILSGRSHPAVTARANELGLTEVHLGLADKLAQLTAICQRHALDLHACGHMGDDLPDLSVMQAVGFSATVSTAVAEVRQQAMWTAQWPAGAGAVRELCDFILKCKSREENGAH